MLFTELAFLFKMNSRGDTQSGKLAMESRRNARATVHLTVALGGSSHYRCITQNERERHDPPTSGKRIRFEHPWIGNFTAAPRENISEDSFRKRPLSSLRHNPSRQILIREEYPLLRVSHHLASECWRKTTPTLGVVFPSHGEVLNRERESTLKHTRCVYYLVRLPTPRFPSSV